MRRNKKKNPHAVALGKLGGKVKSEKKAHAVRENGKKGGRPRVDTANRQVSRLDRDVSNIPLDNSENT